MKALQENVTDRSGKANSRFILLFLLILSLVIFLLLNSYALAVSTLTIRDDGTGGDCGLIGVWNAATKTCTLNTDMDVSGTGGIDAIRIVSNGITLDGAGHIINGDGTGSGVYVLSLDGVTIKNLEVGNFSNGIWLLDTSGTTLHSNYLHQNGNGIYASCTYFPINPTSNNTIYRNRVTQNGYGIWLDWDTSSNEVTTNLVSGNTTAGINLSSADDSTVRRNTIRANDTGLNVFGSNNILVYNNNFDSNTIHAATLSNSISFNQPAPDGGNWWSGWTSPDVDSDGFVDAPYVIILLNNDQDNLPLVTSTDWYDETAPAISNLQPAGDVHTGAVTITADYNDPVPTIGVNTASVTANFTIGPTPPSLPSLNCTATGSPTGSISCTPSSNLSAGIYYVQVSITDNRGNMAVANWGFSVLPYHISDIANGADCDSLGSWDADSKTCTLDTNITAASIDAIHIESNGITLDGGGHTISGNSSYTAGVLVVGRTGVTVRNITANNFNTGIRLENSQGCLIEGNGMVNDSDGLAVYNGANNRITGNSIDAGNKNIYIKDSTGNSVIANDMTGHVEGIRLHTATGNLIKGNSLVGNSRGLAFVYSAAGNTVINNSVRSMGNFLYFEGGGGNTFHSNSFDVCYSSPVLYASGEVNIFNGGDSIGGNYWSSYDTPGEGCVDGNLDGFCDAPYMLLGGAGVDYEPWASDRGWQPDYYWTWYDQLSPGALNWVLLANPVSETSDAWFDLTIAGEGKVLPILEGHSAGQVPPGHVLTPAYNRIMGGPVAVNSRPMSGALVSQRILWAGSSLEEVLGTDANKLSSHFYWTWYDQQSSGYSNWVLVANPSDASVYYEMTIDGADPGAGSKGTIEPGKNATPTFPGKMGGAVEVKAWTDNTKTTPAKVIASQRVLSDYGKAFNEVPGITAEELSDNYIWTWYDSIGSGGKDWVLVANPNGQSVYYEITVAGEDAGTGSKGTIDAGKNVTPAFPGRIGGPLKVRAWTDGTKTIPANVIASQRVIWGPSFEEVPGFPVGALSSTYHWTWYDMQSQGSTNWVLVANPGDQSVYYEIIIGSQPVVVGASGTILPGQNATPNFPGTMGGPVEVRAWTDDAKTTPAEVMASQRVLWNGYFNEVLGTVLN